MQKKEYSRMKLVEFKVAFKDLVVAYRRRYLALMLGWQDIRQRYRRSTLGPFWLTISMGVMIGMIGLIFGQVLNSPMNEYLPYLSVGIILWTCFSTGVMEGVTCFIDSSGMIRQINLPLSIYPLRVLWRNTIVLFHNLLIIPFVFLFVGKGLQWHVLLLIPGCFLFLLNIFWISLLLGIFCTRFRDLPQIVNSVLQVFFYLTPILWLPNSLNKRSASLIVDTNPIYHLIQLVRAPLLGEIPASLSWVVGGVMACLGVLLSMFILGKYKNKISYWL